MCSFGRAEQGRGSACWHLSDFFSSLSDSLYNWVCVSTAAVKISTESSTLGDNYWWFQPEPDQKVTKHVCNFQRAAPKLQPCPATAVTGYPVRFFYCLPSTAFHSGLVLTGWGVCLTTGTTWWLWMICSPRAWRRLTSSSAGPPERR